MSASPAFPAPANTTMVPATPSTRRLIRLFTIGAGINMTYIYLNHPLLGLIGHGLVIAPHALGALPALTATEYASGVFFSGPLGDRYDHHIVILRKAVLLRLTLIADCLVSGLPLFAAVNFIVGLLATITQGFVPSTMAINTDHNRNRNIGTVMARLLVGIVSSHVFSGIVTDHFGWHVVLGVPATTIVRLAIVVCAAYFNVIPPVTMKQPYLTLLRSLGMLFIQHPQLHAATTTQAFTGIAFSNSRPAVALHLMSSLGLSTGQMGLPGLVSAAGAPGTNIAGRLSGRVASDHIAVGGTLPMAATFVAMVLLSQSLVAIATGALIFDVNIQAALVSHQTIICVLAPETRSRISTMFTTALPTSTSVDTYGASLVWTSAR